MLETAGRFHHEGAQLGDGFQVLGSGDVFMFVIDLSYGYEVGVLAPLPATVRTCHKRMATARQKLSFGLGCPQKRQAVPDFPKQPQTPIRLGKTQYIRGRKTEDRGQ
jgi:hypothetical protein